LAKNDQRRPPTHVTGTQRAPDVIATWPNARHGVTTFSASSWNRKRNSLLEPWVDVRADLDAINAGEGIYDPATRWIRVNGRLYGMHENGTKFPIEGDGIIPWNMPGDFPTWYGLTIDDDLVEYVDRALNTVAHGLGTQPRFHLLALGPAPEFGPFLLRPWAKQQELGHGEPP